MVAGVATLLCKLTRYQVPYKSFSTCTSLGGGHGLGAVLMRSRLCSSLPDELQVPRLAAKQGSPQPGSGAQGLESPRCTAICSESIAQMEGQIKRVSDQNLRWEGGGEDNLWESLSLVGRCELR